jgi:hypothetical protein
MNITNAENIKLKSDQSQTKNLIRSKYPLRKDRDSNPGCRVNSTHDFQSCTFSQLGHLSFKKRNKIAVAKYKVNVILTTQTRKRIISPPVRGGSGKKYCFLLAR